MQRSDYPTATDYGFAIGYHAAASGDYGSINAFSVFLPFSELSCYYIGAANGIAEYVADHKRTTCGNQCHA
jgi:hypothetical protein